LGAAAIDRQARHRIYQPRGPGYRPSAPADPRPTTRRRRGRADPAFLFAVTARPWWRRDRGPWWRRDRAL